MFILPKFVLNLVAVEVDTGVVMHSVDAFGMPLAVLFACRGNFLKSHHISAN